ncbi:MAG: hypothetical protein ACYSU1_05540 [Planctomycetota bacterium]|jgi:hypothetical protein
MYAESSFPLIEVVDTNQLQGFEVPWDQEQWERAMAWVLEQESPPDAGD